MSVAELAPDATDASTNDVPYRSVHVLAIAALALGALSSFALLDIWFLKSIPALAVVAGLVGLWRINASPQYHVGRGLALAGMALGVICLTAGSALSAYWYITEVPEDYTRISYEDLQPDPTRPEQVYPPAADLLSGKKVFIKGYAYQPPDGSSMMTTFMLVRDQGQCCFGGNPKTTDMILVKLRSPLQLTWSMNVQRLGGVFRVGPVDAQAGVEGTCVYQLDADYLK